MPNFLGLTLSSDQRVQIHSYYDKLGEQVYDELWEWHFILSDTSPLDEKIATQTVYTVFMIFEKVRSS